MTRWPVHVTIKSAMARVAYVKKSSRKELTRHAIKKLRRCAVIWHCRGMDVPVGMHCTLLWHPDSHPALCIVTAS